MRVQCPFCGERDLREFVVSGDASVSRPDPTAAGAAELFFQATYLRDNLAGRHAESWYHVQGCHSWLRVTRDTRTHEIFAVDFTGSSES